MSAAANAKLTTKKRPGKPVSHHGEANSSTRNATAMPMAEVLCSRMLNDKGKMPTHESMTPMTTNTIDTVRGACAFFSTPRSTSTCRSRCR